MQRQRGRGRERRAAAWPAWCSWQRCSPPPRRRWPGSRSRTTSSAIRCIPRPRSGKIIVGRSAYSDRPAPVAAALKAHRASYNAGVVGPDGFPDIAYGQSQIHPNHTGKWLTYLLRKARDGADRDEGGTRRPASVVTKYSDTEKGQILAFSYGYLTHAAGDMWGHTFINDFAQGPVSVLRRSSASARRRGSPCATSSRSPTSAAPRPAGTAPRARVARSARATRRGRPAATSATTRPTASASTRRSRSSTTSS